MVEVELLSVDGCAHLDAARKLLQDCIDELHVMAHIEEKVGAYQSPTIRVDGKDVMGASSFTGAACRLDVPTRHRVLTALQRRRDRASD
jgi:hypothetical protein